MADFSTEAELSLTVPARELRSAKQQIEQGIGDVSLSLDAGGGPAARSTNRQNNRRLIRWQRQRTEDIGDILDVLTSMEDKIGEGGSGGGLTNFILGRASGALGLGAGAGAGAGLGAGALSSVAGVAGLAAAGPLAGAGIGFALREAGFGARAQGVDTTSRAREIRQAGAAEQRRQPTGPQNINVRISKPNWVPIQVETPATFDPSRGQATRNPLAGGTATGGTGTPRIEVDNTTQIDVTANVDSDEIVRETRREVERDFTRLRREIESSIGGPGGAL